jgi:hypothetical protein
MNLTTPRRAAVAGAAIMALIGLLMQVKACLDARPPRPRPAGPSTALPTGPSPRLTATLFF